MYGNKHCDGINNSDCCFKFDTSENDDIVLSPGGDSCLGGDGDQVIFAKEGNDFVWGGRGNDQIYGGPGGDRLFGSVGDDYVNGGTDNDRLSGGNGSDNILGDDGSDLIHGDTVGDVRRYHSGEPAGLNGEGGTDTISFATAVPPGFDEARSPYSGTGALLSAISGFPNVGNRGVYIDLSGTVRGSVLSDNGQNRNGGGKDTIGGFENVVGSPYSDIIVGDGNPNKIWGGGGADVLIGMGASDALSGGQDGDYLDGNINTGSNDSATDTLNGGGPAPTTTTRNVDQCAVTTETPDSSPGCESTSVTPRRVQVADPAYINVGLMAPMADGVTAGMSPYVTGGTGTDKVSAKFEPNTSYDYGVTKNGAILFTETGSSSFSPNSITTNGCSVQSATTVRCPLGPSGGVANNYAPTLTMTGGSGPDILNTYKSSGGAEVENLPITTVAVLNAGDGNDTLHGESTVEDILIDGSGDDSSWGYGGTDSIYAMDGTDDLHGGSDGDVLYATRACENNHLSGGSGTDNITWAAWNPQFKDSNLNWAQTMGIYAKLQIVSGIHGGFVEERHRGTAGSGCISDANQTLDPVQHPEIVVESASLVDDLYDIENLEGTGGQDKLVGDAENNTLLGRGGVDELWGFGGSDKILAFSNDYDAVIDCGSQSGDTDKVSMDFQRGEMMDVDSLNNCPNQTTTFTNYFNNGSPFQGWPSEYDRSVDVVVSAQENPLAHYRLGERHGVRAFDSTATALPDSGNGHYVRSGKYVGENDAMNPPSNTTSTGDRAIPDTADKAHSFDGSNDMLVLSSGGNVGDVAEPTAKTTFDPFTYRSQQFVVQMWARFNGAPAGAYNTTPSLNKAQYLFSKTDGTNGISLYRDTTAAGPLTSGTPANIVLRIERASGTDLTLSRSAPTDGKWHHYSLVITDGADHAVGVLATHIDTVTNAILVGSSAFPSAANAQDARIGASPTGSVYLPADVDNLLIFGHGVPGCEVSRQVDLSESPPSLSTC